MSDPTGYPSIDLPWLKYYSKEELNIQIPTCSIYENMYRHAQSHSKDSDISVTMNTYTHLGMEDAVDEMNWMQQLESARKEQEALSGKTDEVRLSKKHFRAG